MIRRMMGWLSSSSPAAESAGPRPKGASVLVVDDDDHLRELLRIQLEGAGYDVRVAANGALGVEEAQRLRPDVIVLDANMPVLDGFGALAKLKGQRQTREIPVLMLTTRSHQGDVLAGYRKGAQAYLTKPFIAEEVIDNVQRLLKRHGAAR
jgi:DNA-binding response OmpR family regulator